MIYMVDLDKTFFTTYLFLDVKIKCLFSLLQFHIKFTVYNTDGEDLPKGPPPSSGVSVEWKIIYSFSSIMLLFLKMSCICTVYLYHDISKIPFVRIDNYISLLFIQQMMKIYLKGHPLQAVIWISVNCKVIFSFLL